MRRGRRSTRSHQQHVFVPLMGLHASRCALHYGRILFASCIATLGMAISFALLLPPVAASRSIRCLPSPADAHYDHLIHALSVTAKGTSHCPARWTCDWLSTRFRMPPSLSGAQAQDKVRRYIASVMRPLGSSRVRDAGETFAPVANINWLRT